jgi:hypothetical protein
MIECLIMGHMRTWAWILPPPPAMVLVLNELIATHHNFLPHYIYVFLPHLFAVAAAIFFHLHIMYFPFYFDIFTPLLFLIFIPSLWLVFLALDIFGTFLPFPSFIPILPSSHQLRVNKLLKSSSEKHYSKQSRVPTISFIVKQRAQFPMFT